MASPASPSPRPGPSGVEPTRPFAAMGSPHPESSHAVPPPRGGSDAEEPSVDWGWHGSFPRVTVAAGWLTAAAMFLMLIGNHTGTLEDWFLIVTGSGLVALLVAGSLRRRS